MRRCLQFIFLLLAASAFGYAPEREGFSLNTLAVYADHPSGQFTTNRLSTFTVAAGATDKEESQYDGAGNVTNRVWRRADGQVVRSQALSWDALGRLVKIKDRDAANNGFNFQSVFDGLGRQVQTIETLVTNNIALATNPAPLVVSYIYDPMTEFLIVGVSVGQGVDSRTDWLAYGPDISGSYGGMEGIGGLEMVTSGDWFFNTSVGIINDGFGNIIGGVSDGTVGWNASRLNLYAPVEGFAPPRLSLDNPTHASLAWRTRPMNIAGLVQLGERPYDFTRRAFLAADPLGHDADPGLNTAFGGNPAFNFDPTGRDWKQHYANQAYPDSLQYGIALYGRLPDYGGYDPFFGGNRYGWYGRPESGNLLSIIGGGSQQSSFSFGSFAADTFLNQSDRDYAANEWNNADWRSPLGITVGVVAGVSWTANTIDAGANMIPIVGTGKAFVENTAKAGIKAIGGVFFKEASERGTRELIETGSKEAVEIGVKNVASLTKAEVDKLYPRVRARQGLLEDVWDRSKAPNGKVYDPSGVEIKPGDYWELGHRPGHKFSDAQRRAAEQGWDRNTWRQYQNDSDIYRPELRPTNAGHGYESEW